MPTDSGSGPGSGASPEVLLLAKRFPPVAGGVAQYSVEVGRAYARRDLQVLALTQSSAAPGWSVDSGESRLRVLNIGRGSQPIAFVKFLIATAWLMRSHRFSLVHATTWRMALVARMLAPKVPLVVTVHGREVLNFPWFLGGALRHVLRRATLVFTVSNATMEVARAAVGRRPPRGKWLVRYNGLSFPQLAQAATPRSEEQQSVEVLSLCRLVPRKNVAVALRAVAAARAKTGVPIHFSIAGTGPDRVSLEALGHELELGDVVDFLGFVDDAEVPELYSRADIFVHPHTHVGEGNDFEGFGITIADAMSFGCAVVVGRAGGPAELVTDEVDGRLVDGADLQSVADALGDLLGDPSYRSKLGVAARRSALERFSWDKHIEPAVAVLGE